MTATLATALIVLFLLGLGVVIFWKKRNRRGTNSADDANQISFSDKPANAEEGSEEKNTQQHA